MTLKQAKEFKSVAQIRDAESMGKPIEKHHQCGICLKRFARYGSAVRHDKY